ncbi:MAG: BrnT family toxin [Magnetococcus sp. DMHC-1]
MKIEFDPDKEYANRLKHGVSLGDVEGLDWERSVISLDRRHDYGEPRMIGYVPKRNRLYCVVFADREGVRRIISLRKANKRETKRYARDVHGIHSSHS